MRQAANRKKPVDRVLAALINTLSIIYPHLYFPTYSNSLKVIGGYLGCSWNDPSLSGIQSIALRKRWEVSHDDQLKQKLIEYNLEDCAALKQVSNFISRIGKTGPSVVDNGDTQPTPDIALAESINPLPEEHEW